MMLMSVETSANSSELNGMDQATFMVSKLYQAGEYAKALPFAIKALNISKRILGENDSDYATNLNNLAMLYEKIGEYAKALPLQQQALQVNKQALGDEHPYYIVSLNNVAGLYEDMGKYVKALPLYHEAFQVSKRTLSEKSPLYATTLNNLATLYSKMGDYTKALPLYQQALNIRERILGKEHPSYATSLDNLASLYQRMGDYAKALPLYQQALGIRERILGKEHPSYATSLDNLASLYQRMGEYAKALPLYQQALGIRERILGKEHPSYATSLNNLAALYDIIGSYDEALPLYQQALDIRERTLGEEHPAYAVSLNNLALIYHRNGNYVQAINMYQRVLQVSKKVLGEDNYVYTGALNNLAILYLKMGNNDKSLSLLQQSLELTKRGSGENHSDYAISLNNLATYYKSVGDYTKALHLFKNSLDIRKCILGEAHPDYINSIYEIAFLYASQDKPEKGLTMFLQGETLTDRLIQNTFPVLDEKKKLMFVRLKAGGYYGLLSLIQAKFPTNMSAIRSGLDAVLSRKAIVFDAQSRQGEAIAKSLNPTLKQWWGELAMTRGIYAKFIQAKPNGIKPSDYQAKLKRLQTKITSLENKLASKNALISQNLKQRHVSYKQVAQTLGSDATLIEYVKVQDYDWKQVKWVESWRYLAFVLHGDGSVKLVDLGGATELEKSVQQAITTLGNIAKSQGEQDLASKMLDRLLWQPIKIAVGDTSKIVFSPDGILNLVPFAAMQDVNGEYLIEKKQVSYVTSGRDLAKEDTGIKPESELYLAANPSYDLEIVSSIKAVESRGVTRSADFSMQFGPLPGTEQEAQQVTRLLKGQKTVVMGKDATEESVLSIRRPKVMHLATHGFFLKDQLKLSSSNKRGVTQTSLPKGYENPLVRSGLAFAGANHAVASTSDRDGLLTALEASGMDLHGTDLVTLSACETGVGEVKSSEGVYGLRRAFALAGTKNLVMSLWAVNDSITASQMNIFYQQYAQGDKPTEALRKAQLSTIKMLREVMGDAPPALWAPFIVQGAF